MRKAKYDLDHDEIKPYLQLDKIRDGMFWAPKELYDFNFTPVSGVPVLHPDISVWEVSRERQARSGCGTSIPTRATASARARG